MRGIAAKAFARGMNVVRLNQRNCGDTEHLSAGLFHSGLTADAEARHRRADRGRRHLPAIAVAGYSLGGNLALKLAGEYGDDAAARRSRAVAAVSPILEIGECVRALERPGNVLYQWNFVRGSEAPDAAQGRASGPGASICRSSSAIRTVREFDEAYTAPYFGFADAEDYYHRASAMRVIDRIRVPALIITAEDDPFVPVAAVPRSEGHRQPAHHAARVRARRPLRLRRPAHRRRRRRLLGGESDRRVRRSRPASSRSRARVVSSRLSVCVQRPEAFHQQPRELRALSLLLRA